LVYLKSLKNVKIKENWPINGSFTMPQFDDFPDLIESWTLTREKFRFSNKDAMGKMRALERLAAVKLGLSGDLTKAEKSVMESEAQRIYNGRTEPDNEKYMAFASSLLDEAQAFITAKGLSTKSYHQVELLCKYIHRFNADGDVQTNIAKDRCTELFCKLLQVMVTEGPAVGFDKLPDFAIALSEKLNKDLYNVASVDTGSQPPVDALAAFLSQAPLITPARNAAVASSAPVTTVPPSSTEPTSRSGNAPSLDL